MVHECMSPLCSPTHKVAVDSMMQTAATVGRSKPRKGSQCPRCKRDFSSTLNPLVSRPAKTDLLKRRGSNAHCVACHGVCTLNPSTKTSPARTSWNSSMQTRKPMISTEKNTKLRGVKVVNTRLARRPKFEEKLGVLCPHDSSWDFFGLSSYSRNTDCKTSGRRCPTKPCNIWGGS